MFTLKEYDTKLNRLKSTRKMTRTMQMVAANKLRKAQGAQKMALNYSQPLNRMLCGLMAGRMPFPHALTVPRERVRNVLVLVVTSDRGLCGGFNSNLNRHVEHWLFEKAGKCEDVQLSFCGRRGLLFFKDRANILKHYEGVSAKPRFSDSRRIALELQEMFLSGRVDEVYVAFNASKTSISREPVIERVLPMDAVQAEKQDESAPITPLFEPSLSEAWDSLVPQLVTLIVHSALLSSSVGEHSARMMSMESATTNANKLVDDYTILRNQARQSAITNELIEIVGGAEALR